MTLFLFASDQDLILTTVYAIDSSYSSGMKQDFSATVRISWTANGLKGLLIPSVFVILFN